jgi:hypothetical protein
MGIAGRNLMADDRGDHRDSLFGHAGLLASPL